MAKTYYIYILSNTSRMLYTGVTGNFLRHVLQHKRKEVDGFTKRYNLTRLVYFEKTNDIRAALGREKQLKSWVRSKKVALTESVNPRWKDLAADWVSETTGKQ